MNNYPTCNYGELIFFHNLLSDHGTHTCGRRGPIELSRDMRFPTIWYVRPVTAQINLRIRAV